MIRTNIIKNDGTAIQVETSSWREAAERVLKMADDSFYNKTGFFLITMGNPQAHPEVVTIGKLRDDLKNGRVPDHD